MRREFARLKHFPDNVAAADELTLDVKLGNRRPAGKFLDPLPDFVAGEAVDRCIGNAQIIHDLHDLPRKSALRKVRGSLHKQNDVILVDRRLDVILDGHWLSFPVIVFARLLQDYLGTAVRSCSACRAPPSTSPS